MLNLESNHRVYKPSMSVPYRLPSHGAIHRGSCVARFGYFLLAVILHQVSSKQHSALLQYHYRELVPGQRYLLLSILTGRYVDFGHWLCKPFNADALGQRTDSKCHASQTLAFTKTIRLWHNLITPAALESDSSRPIMFGKNLSTINFAKVTPS